MKEYSILAAPLYSFFSKSFYMDAGTRRQGTGLLYLFVLTIISLVPGMIRVHIGTNELIDEELRAVADSVPEIVINEGVVNSDVEQPYFIEDANGEKQIAVLDTTGKIDSLADTEAVLLMTSDSVMIRKSEYETQVFDLKDVKAYRIDGKKVHGWLDWMGKYAALALSPFALFGSYIMRAIQALICVVFGMIFASWCSINLSFKALMRLATMALTPGIVIGAVSIAAGISIPLWGLFSMLLALGYLFFGINAVSTLAVEPSEQSE